MGRRPPFFIPDRDAREQRSSRGPFAQGMDQDARPSPLTPSLPGPARKNRPARESRPEGRLSQAFAIARLPRPDTFRRRKSLEGLLARALESGGFGGLAALLEDELVAMRGNLADARDHRSGACRNETSHNDVLLQPFEHILLAVDRGLGEDACRLLEGGSR